MELTKEKIIEILRSKINVIPLGNQNYSFKLYFEEVADEIIKVSRVELLVIQNANDIGLDLTLPKRMGWTEFTEDNIVFHYSTEEEYNNCENAKRLGIKVSVSV